MADISNVKAARFQEMERKRHNYELKKLRSENHKKFQKEVKSNEAMMSRMRRDYEVQVKNLENDLERKLIETRAKHKRSITAENKRLNEELTNLKKAHQDQVGEVKISQDNEIENMVTSHRETLENAKQKYIREKQKWDELEA